MEKSKISQDLRQNKINMLQASFQAVLEQEDLFSKIIDFSHTLSMSMGGTGLRLW